MEKIQLITGNVECVTGKNFQTVGAMMVREIKSPLTIRTLNTVLDDLTVLALEHDMVSDVQNCELLKTKAIDSLKDSDIDNYQLAATALAQKLKPFGVRVNLKPAKSPWYKPNVYTPESDLQWWQKRLAEADTKPFYRTDEWTGRTPNAWYASYETVHLVVKEGIKIATEEIKNKNEYDYNIDCLLRRFVFNNFCTLQTYHMYLDFIINFKPDFKFIKLDEAEAFKLIAADERTSSDILAELATRVTINPNEATALALAKNPNTPTDGLLTLQASTFVSVAALLPYHKNWPSDSQFTKPASATSPTPPLSFNGTLTSLRSSHLAVKEEYGAMVADLLLICQFPLYVDSTCSFTADFLTQLGVTNDTYDLVSRDTSESSLAEYSRSVRQLETCWTAVKQNATIVGTSHLDAQVVAELVKVKKLTRLMNASSNEYEASVAATKILATVERIFVLPESTRKELEDKKRLALTS